VRIVVSAPDDAMVTRFGGRWKAGRIAGVLATRADGLIDRTTKGHFPVDLFQLVKFAVAAD